MISFYKYEGAGNDFIMINNLEGRIKLESGYIIHICDRHFGIGADGVILLEKSDKPEVDCFMNYYNSDGTLAEMCGNGVRCTAKFYLEQTGKSDKELNIDTRAGIKKIICNNDDTYSVDMGTPIFESPDFPSEDKKIEGFDFKTCTSQTGTSIFPSEDKKIEGFDFKFVSMGNPHAVTLVSSLNEIVIKDIGPKIENNPLFPNKINVEFIEKINDEYYKVKVWERGCGETLACGTGACAIFSILNKLSARTFLAENPIGKTYGVKEITLEFPGGKLYLSQNKQDHVILRGPATFVFKGEI